MDAPGQGASAPSDRFHGDRGDDAVRRVVDLACDGFAAQRIVVASGIANIAFRDPIATATATRALGEAFPGRYTVADHITVLDQALAQIPDAHRHGTDILVRTDSAGSAKAFLTHLRALRARSAS